MKLLTLNTHSLIIPEHEAKREIFVDFIAKEQPEVFALQEVNQTASAPLLEEVPAGYYPCPGNHVPLKADNHAAAVAKMLAQRGIHYDWSWLPAKIGYDIYDEGAAVFSRAPITDAENLLLSQINDYNNWKTRRTLGVCAGDVWYYTVHLGWWKDEAEPFAPQWEKLSKAAGAKKTALRASRGSSGQRISVCAGSPPWTTTAGSCTLRWSTTSIFSSSSTSSGAS